MIARVSGIALLAGCAGGDGKPPGTGETADTGPQLVTLENVGTACAYGDGLPQTPGAAVETTFSGDAPFDVQVVLDDCALGCAADVTASCEVRLVSGEIVVTASGSYTLPGGTPDCAAVCVEVVASCPGELLAPGYWAVDYAGGHSDGFTVPGTVPAPCAAAR